VLLTPLIFILVKAPGDYIWLLLIQSSTFLVSGAAGAILVRRRLRSPLRLPRLRDTGDQLRDGWHTFLASVTINLYTSTNIVILSLMTNPMVVGYYSAAQKIVAAIQSLWTPFSQALYPHFCKSFARDAARTGKRLTRLAAVVTPVTLTGATVVCLTARRFVPLYLSASFARSTPVVQILIFSVCAITVSNIFGLQGLLAAGFREALLKAVALAALVSLILAPVSIAVFGAMGLAGTTVLVEALLCVRQFQLLKRGSII
jgi:PST family polysaccharide transporter